MCETCTSDWGGINWLPIEAPCLKHNIWLDLYFFLLMRENSLCNGFEQMYGSSVSQTVWHASLGARAPNIPGQVQTAVAISSGGAAVAVGGSNGLGGEGNKGKMQPYQNTLPSVEWRFPIWCMGSDRHLSSQFIELWAKWVANKKHWRHGGVTWVKLSPLAFRINNLYNEWVQLMLLFFCLFSMWKF